MSNSLDPDQAHQNLIWVQIVCKGYQQTVQQRSVKRSNFVEPGYNYLTCHNNFPFNSQSIKVYFSHYSNTVLSKLPE